MEPGVSSKSTAIELETDDRFQKTEWRVQRVGWVIWICILVAAVLGFVGPGLFSQTRSVARDHSLVITYDRFVHFHHPTTFSVAFELESVGTDHFELTVSKVLLECIDIQRIDPEPKRSAITRDGVAYLFETDGQSRTGTLIFHVDYETPGRVAGNITLSGHQPANIAQFVFP